MSGSVSDAKILCGLASVCEAYMGEMLEAMTSGVVKGDAHDALQGAATCLMFVSGAGARMHECEFFLR